MANDTKLYPPLRLIKEMDSTLQKFEAAKHALAGKRFSDILAVEIDTALDALNVALKLKYHVDPNSRQGKTAKQSMISLMYDHVFTAMILSEWMKNKQTYCFSEEFRKMLSDMEDFDIEMSIFKYMPYETVYLEMENHEHLEGVFVRYSQETQELIFSVLFKNTRYYTETGVNGGYLDPRNNGSFKKFFENELGGMPANPDDEVVGILREAMVFMLQGCMYLCAKNADINENPVQKQIYRPGGKIKNRYAEVRKWDVGLRVVREHKAATSAMQNHKGLSSDRKRPRQHWRKAHWHTYCVGPGRKERVLKFIAPMLINDNNDDAPIVKHE